MPRVPMPYRGLAGARQHLRTNLYTPNGLTPKVSGYTWVLQCAHTRKIVLQKAYRWGMSMWGMKVGPLTHWLIVHTPPDGHMPLRIRMFRWNKK